MANNFTTKTEPYYKYEATTGQPYATEDKQSVDAGYDKNK